LRSFDQRYHLTHDWAAVLRDSRDDDRIEHDGLRLLRKRLYRCIRSSPVMKMPMTPTAYVMIPYCKSSPIRN
jgi:hypothetical protein